MGFLTINTSCSCEYLSATLIRNVCFRSLRLPGVLLSRITLKAGEVALQRWGQPWAERLLFVQGNPRQSQEGNPSMFTRGINYPSWRKKKKKKKAHTFLCWQGFFKGSHASLVLLDLHKESLQEYNPLRQQLKPRNRLLEEQTAVRLHPVSGCAKCFFHHLLVLCGL